MGTITHLTCPICLQSVTNNGVVLSCAIDGCSSVYHEECARDALSRSDKCPVCRRDASPEIMPLNVLWHTRYREQRKLEKDYALHLERLGRTLDNLRCDLETTKQNQTTHETTHNWLVSELQSTFLRVFSMTESLKFQLGEIAESAHKKDEQKIQILSMHTTVA